MTASGLTSDIELGKAAIRVCEKPCENIVASSTSSVFSCSVPAISTTRSNSEFTIQEESNLTGERVIYSAMTEDAAKRTLDGAILPTIADSEADCYVGIQMPTGYVGVVNEISFFLDEFDTGNIYDRLFIEASSDNFVDVDAIALLVAVSEEAHEGWNYYDLTGLETPARYQYYRLRSDVQGGGCDPIGEIHYIGYEVIDDENDTYDCNVELVEFGTDVDGVITETKTDLTETVVYNVDSTPVVDDI